MTDGKIAGRAFFGADSLLPDSTREKEGSTGRGKGNTGLCLKYVDKV